MGLIYYIGPLLTEEDFMKNIETHIKDTSLGLTDNNRFFKVNPIPINRIEVNAIYQFCKSFEDQFYEEIKHLMEYRVSLTDRSTYFVDDQA